MAINLLAVLVAAVAAMVGGMIWYSPGVFGNIWMKLSGLSKADLAKQKKKGMAKSMIVGFIATLVTAYFLASVVSFVGGSGVTLGIVMGVFIWFGFVATASLDSVLWAGTPFKLWLLNNSHKLVSFVIMGAIIGVWV